MPLDRDEPPLLEGYDVGRVIGRGAHGDVWIAWPSRIERDGGPAVAVKRRPMPERGPVALRRLPSHPGILPVLDLVADRGDLLVVLPLLEGGTLADLLVERGALAGGETVAIVQAVAAALAALHADGRVHGDLKPANLLLDGTGEPVIGDVDDAVLEVDPAERRGPTGTPGYLAPERLDGARPSASADLYALGAIAYECLTGSRPHRVSTGTRRPLSSWASVSAAVAAVVEQALAASPEGRPGDVASWAARLAAAVPADEVALPGPAKHPAIVVAAPESARTVIVGPGAPHHREPPAGADRADRGTVQASGRLRRHRRSWVLRGVAVGAGVLAVASVAQRTNRQPSAPERATTATAADPRTCDPAPSTELPVGTTLVGRLDHRGCEVQVSWEDGVLHVPDGGSVRRYAIGGPHDQVVLGDWDGDGVDEPAAYASDRGEVRFLAGLPEAIGDREAAVRTEDAPLGGVAAVVGRADGRGDEVVVVVEP